MFFIKKSRRQHRFLSEMKYIFREKKRKFYKIIFFEMERSEAEISGRTFHNRPFHRELKHAFFPHGFIMSIFSVK